MDGWGGFGRSAITAKSLHFFFYFYKKFLSHFILTSYMQNAGPRVIIRVAHLPDGLTYFSLIWPFSVHQSYSCAQRVLLYFTSWQKYSCL
jgi:hypothetical protein